TWVAAREIENVKPGSSIEVEAGETAYPKPFSSMPAGDYEAQAVLDVGHSYNYGGRAPEDWVSSVNSLAHWSPVTGAEPVLVLDQHPPANPQRASREKMMANVRPGVQKEEFVSNLLSRFWGRPTSIRAWVILPPGYDTSPNERYPTVYWTHGFGGKLDSILSSGMRIRERMEQGKMPPMIWVMLEESHPGGTHEFADSVNNGP